MNVNITLVVLFSMSRASFATLRPSPRAGIGVSSSLSVNSNLGRLSVRMNSRLDRRSRGVDGGLGSLAGGVVGKNGWVCRGAGA